MLDPTQRAKRVLDICAYELKCVSVGSQMTLESAIAAEIQEALSDQLCNVNRKSTEMLKQVPNFHPEPSEEKQSWLLKIRKRKPK